MVGDKDVHDCRDNCNTHTHSENIETYAHTIDAYTQLDKEREHRLFNMRKLRDRDINATFCHKRQQEFVDKIRTKGPVHNSMHLLSDQTCYDLDYAELRELMNDKLLQTIQARHIDCSKPIKVVFMDYDNTLQKSTNLFRNFGQRLMGLTAFGKVLVDNKYALTVKDNTIYIIFSGRHDGDASRKKRFDETGIFDMYVTMHPVSYLAPFTKGARVFGKFKEAATFKQYVCQLHDSSNQFKRAVLSNVVDLLQSKYKCPKLEVVLVDDNSQMRKLALKECRDKAVYRLLLVDATQIKPPHIQRHIKPSILNPKYEEFAVTDCTLHNSTEEIAYDIQFKDILIDDLLAEIFTVDNYGCSV